MNKTLALIVVVFILLLGGTSYAIELDTPQNASLELVETNGPYFHLKWQDSSDIEELLKSGNMLDMFSYDVSVYIRLPDRAISRSIQFSPTTLKKQEDGFLHVKLAGKDLGLPEDSINIMQHSYSFRVRYILTRWDILGKYTITSNYSPSLSIGLVYPYNYPSTWAIPELNKAFELGLLTSDVCDNMKNIVTREEFAELMVKFYEKKTGTISSEGMLSFTDTNNIEVLKAANLGLVKGYNDGSFKPDNPITRQDIAVIIYRTLEKARPNIAFNNAIPVKESIANYARKSVEFFVGEVILKGDKEGLINPLRNTTCEEASVLSLRVFEKYK